MRKMLTMLLSIAVLLIFAACQSEENAVSTDVTTGVTTEATTQATTEPTTEATVETTEETTEVTEETTDTTESTVELEEPKTVLGKASLFGVDLSGKDYTQAKEAMNAAINGYELSFTANNHGFKFTAKDLSMSLSEQKFNKWFTKKSQGEQATTDGIIKYDSAAAVETVDQAFTVEPKNATVVYDRSKQKFVSKTHSDGISADVAAAKSAINKAVKSMNSSAEAKVKTEEDLAKIPLKDSRVDKAVKAANACLEVKLTYVYSASGIPTTEATIPRETIVSFVGVDEEMNVVFDSSAISSYVTEVSYTNGGVMRRNLETTGGGTVGLTVDYYEAMLDKEALRNDITNCLKKNISGKRNAPFRSHTIRDMPYAGTYVEIDLDNQCLWMYYNGNQVVSTSLVSGNVSTGCATPPGVFSLTYKTKSTYLVGANYRSYVDYWMPFNGGIGMHDANWRNSFGSDIYMYDGSHGCINLPTGAAATIYSYISAGTKVLVYGGASRTGTLTQELSGTGAYVLDEDDSSFQLDVTAKYTSPTLKYSSSDTNVVTVDSQGNVTVVGPGEAVITVVSPKTGSFSYASFEIRIIVEGEATEPTTTPTEPEETTTPTEPEETTTPTEPEETTTPTEPETTAPTEPEETTAPTEPETTSATEPSQETALSAESVTE